MKKERENIGRVPNLRFPQFAGEWEVKKLGEMMEFIKDKIPSASLSLKNYVSTENLLQNFQGVTSASSIPLNVNVTSYKMDDILFSNIRPYLKKIWKANLSGGCSSDVFVFRNNESCLSGFLYYSIANEDFINYVMIGAKGVKMPRGDKEQIQQYPIFLPSLPEQQKIASFLSLIDERIATQSKIIEGLKELKASLSKHIFSYKLRFKDEGGKDFPEWGEPKLGEIAETYSGGTPTSTNNSYYIGNIPFIKSGEISSDKTEQFINEEALKNSSAKMVSKGDLLLALYGATSGEVAISKIAGAINQAVLVIRTEQNTNYLHHFLRCNKGNIISTYLQGGQGNLSAQIVKSILIKLPSLREQQKIAYFLSNIDSKIEIETKTFELQKRQKQYLLRQMFI